MTSRQPVLSRLPFLGRLLVPGRQARSTPESWSSHMKVSWNRGTPSHHPNFSGSFPFTKTIQRFWGTPMYGNPHMMTYDWIWLDGILTYIHHQWLLDQLVYTNGLVLILMHILDSCQTQVLRLFQWCGPYMSAPGRKLQPVPLGLNLGRSASVQTQWG